MTGELRILGLAHGLLLGLLLAAPVLAPSLLPWATGALFLSGGFQLRLTDRRFALRGRASWVSHIRMAPRRLLPWGAASLGALASGQDDRAVAIMLAASACELLLYPLCASAMARLSRPLVALLLVALLLAGWAATSIEAVAFAVAFLTGMAACLFWLRGPDGDPVALALSAAAACAAPVLAMTFPATTPFAFAAGSVSALVALAHLSVWRRRPVPWLRAGGAASSLRRPLWPRPQQQS